MSGVNYFFGLSLARELPPLHRQQRTAEQKERKRYAKAHRRILALSWSLLVTFEASVCVADHRAKLCSKYASVTRGQLHVRRHHKQCHL